MTQKEEEGGYVFKPIHIFDFYFGFISGALNTLPVGSNLNTCGRNLRQQQDKVTEMIKYMEQRDIKNTIDNMAAYMFYINYTAVPCYQGTKEILFNNTF